VKRFKPWHEQQVFIDNVALLLVQLSQPVATAGQSMRLHNVARTGK
jgi:hypothetical protein